MSEPADDDLSAERCAALEALSHTGSWWGDPTTGALRMSAEAGRLLGLPPGPQTVEAVLAVLHPEDRAETAAAWAVPLAPGVTVERRYRVQGAGPERWLGERRHRLSATDPRQVAVLSDLSERWAQEDRVATLAQRLRDLGGELVRVQEHERQHLARELHDEIGQELTALLIGVRNPERRLPAGVRRELVAHINRLIERVRDVSLDLRPSLLDDLGLVPALRSYAEREAGRGGLALRLDLRQAGPRLRPDVETALFRIAQEAVSNVLRHADARSLTLEFDATVDPVRLRIADDGRGFVHGLRPDGRRHFGLLGMRERARLLGGDVRVSPVPGQGTRVEAWIPQAPAQSGPSLPSAAAAPQP